MSLIRCRCLLLPAAVLLLSSLLCQTAGAADSLPTTPSTASIEHDVLHFSYELQHWLDVSKRPCQDFYGYVCGSSLNGTQAQALSARSLQQKEQNFEQFLAADNDEQLMDVELKLKQFYVSCKAARAADDLKSSLLYRLAGGWPAVDDTAAMIRLRRNLTWLDVLSAFHEVGAFYIFRSRVEVKSNKRIVQLEPDDTLHYTLRKFEQLVGEVLQEHAVDAGRARLVALETLSFERSRREQLRKPLPEGEHELTYDSFKALFSATLQPEWDAYFRKLLGKPPKANDTVLVRQLPKLLDCFQLLQNTTMTRLLNWIWIDYLTDKTSSNCQQLVEQYFAPVYQHIVQRSGVDKVQMAQLYSALGRTYRELLVPSSWIDEFSELNSMQMLGRVIHLTLNGDSTLDADYRELVLTPRNFYRNLERLQRFLAQVHRNTARAQSGEALQAATDYMQVLLLVNALLQQQQNLSTPLNYALVGERFAEHMIAAGSSSSTLGAWRSMDSELDFSNFRQCVARQTAAASSASPASAAASAPTSPTGSYNLNDLVLKLLAQKQALLAFQRWQQGEPALTRRLDGLLAAGRLKLSLHKLYFIGALLTDCGEQTSATQRELLHSYLRNSPDFTQAFSCRATDAHYARNVCKVL